MMKVKSTLVTVAAVGLVLTAFNSCNNAAPEQSTAKADSAMSDTRRIDSLNAKKRTAIEFKFSTLEDNLPAPFSIVNDIYSFNVAFKGELLNPPANLSKYTSTYKKEVNYGVYGLDLGYISFYGHNQDLLNFYASTKTLSEQLNVSKVFDQFADRFKANSSNKDSVIGIVDNVYKETDDYLKKNDRFLAASHILAGALIELNYLSLNLIKDVPQTEANGKLFEKVYIENLYIYHLMKLYEEFKDKDSQSLLADMKAYSKSYSEIIKGAKDMTPANVNKAVSLITDLRNKLVK
jgi:hypothetical protein